MKLHFLPAPTHRQLTPAYDGITGLALNELGSRGNGQKIF
jgi:hypothetical protein